MERPNTVAGLNVKRDELIKLRKHLEAEHHKVTCDIDHLDAAIRLFDPANAPTALKRYVVQYRARKGYLRRFVLAALRDALTPLTSRQITEAWVADRGLKTDEATYAILRKRIGACLISLRAAGLVADVGTFGEYKVWKIA
jgi:hypothetical protein